MYIHIYIRTYIPEVYLEMVWAIASAGDFDLEAPTDVHLVGHRVFEWSSFKVSGFNSSTIDGAWDQKPNTREFVKGVPIQTPSRRVFPGDSYVDTFYSILKIPNKKTGHIQERTTKESPGKKDTQKKDPPNF